MFKLYGKIIINNQLLVRIIMNNGCRQGRHAHAHSGARVVGRDVGCGWVGLCEWFFSFFNFHKTNLIFLLYVYIFFLFARKILFHSHKYFYFCANLLHFLLTLISE